MKNIIVLGCTGSIGTQTLDIVRRFPDEFRIRGISAHGHSPDSLTAIAAEFHPDTIVLMDETISHRLQSRLHHQGIRVESGTLSHAALARGDFCPVDIVVSAVSGTAGLIPTLAAIDAGISVALANKETLVTGGEYVIDRCRKSGSHLLPIDSEHSAISQCLAGLHRDDVSHLILTCSGGPFTRQPEIDLETVTPAMALAHPTWNMGKKISIDSATLMNKGLEIIEAHWLFDIPENRIGVVIHPQSIVHSMVVCQDGSVMANMGRPDMRHPILYALSGGYHWACDLPRLDFTQPLDLAFAPPDTDRFPCLGLARRVLQAGGTMPAVLNAADEWAVDAFCRGEIAFTSIPEVIDSVLQAHDSRPLESLEIIREVERWTLDWIRKEWSR
ncbi:1-deoxy-D-xylulose-5-phosphate reductoisomerase [bacterium]|nr:1-deoxy-D-xylulose-5-phosphate reductoisomerase [candidate division CSSED10-310 bacterium]